MSTTADATNKNYWQSISANEILAGVQQPGTELLPYIQQSSKVLDIGCGSGKLIPGLLKNSAHVTGIDINADAITKNQKNYPNATFLVADVTQQLPFKDETFDVIVMAYVLTSIIDPQIVAALTKELVRILKPGGVIWLSEPIFSPDYEETYTDGKVQTGYRNVGVLRNNETSEVKRFFAYYDKVSLMELLSPLTLQYESYRSNTSSHSRRTVETLVALVQK